MNTACESPWHQFQGYNNNSIFGQLFGGAQQQQTTQQKERTENSMLYTVAVTQTPSPIEQQNGESEKLVAGPDTVLARDGNVAMLIFGAKHAEEILKGSPDRMQVNLRAGA